MLPVLLAKYLNEFRIHSQLFDQKRFEIRKRNRVQNFAVCLFLDPAFESFELPFLEVRIAMNIVLESRLLFRMSKLLHNLIQGKTKTQGFEFFNLQAV